MDKRISITDLKAMKRRGEKIVMITAYDYPSARLVEEAGVPLILVGDSLGNVVLGYDSTIPVTMDEMLHHVKPVVRATRKTHVVADMPFMSYQTGPADALRNAGRMLKEGGAQSVKLEGGGETSVARARAIVNAGIPVMGHVGLTPQTATALGGYKAQGRTAEAAARVAREALALQEAGCFSIVFEAIPTAVAEAIMPQMEAVVIGIGAGPATDGQVLVFHDLLGIREGLGARFVKRYASLQEEMDAGVAAFAEDVRERRYPAEEHTYSIPDEELEAFRTTAELEGRLGSWEALEGF